MARRRSSRSSAESLGGGNRFRPLPVAILVLLALAPIPLGSTPPLSWTVWGALVGITAVATALSRLFSTAQPRRPLPLLWVGQAGMLVVAGYLVVQMLPVGLLFGPIPLMASDGSYIEMSTISVAPGDTALMLVRMLTFGLLLSLTAQAATSQRNRNLLLDGIVLITTLHALHGLLALFQFGDTLLGMEKLRYQGVATGTFLNRNTFATFLAMGTAVALSGATRSIVQTGKGPFRLGSDFKSVLYLVAAAIMVTTVVTTQSRAGLVVTLVGIAIVLIVTVTSNVRALRPVLLATPVLLVLFGAMFLRLGEAVWLRYEYVTGSFDFRLELYRQAVTLIAHRPLLGFGGGTFELAFTTVHTTDLDNQLSWNEAHNTYLELWSDLGLVVGSIPVLLVAGLFLLIISRLVRAQGSWTGQTAALASIGIVAIHSLFDFSLEIESVAFLFVVVCGIGLAAASARRVTE